MRPAQANPVTDEPQLDAPDLALAWRPSARRLAGDAGWILAGQILAVICALATLAVWAKYLRPDELGFMALVVAFASVLVGVVSGPILQALVVGYAHHDKHGNARAYRWTTARFLRRHLLFVSAGVLLLTFPASYLLEVNAFVLMAIIPLFVIDSLREYERMLFSCVGRQRVVSAINVIDVWTRLLAVWAGLELFGGSAEVAILSTTGGALLAFLAISMMFGRVAYPGVQLPGSPLHEEIRAEIVHIAAPLAPSAILGNLSEMTNRYVIGATMSLHAAGIFVMAYGLVKRPYGMVRDVGAVVMMPILSRAHASGSPADVRRARLLWLGTMAAVCATGGLLFYWLGGLIVALLLNDSYGDVAGLLPLLAIGIALYNMAWVLDDFAICERRSRAVLVNRAADFAVNLLLLVVLTSTMGLTGAAWALAGGSIAHLLVATWNILRSPARLPERSAS